MDFSSQSPAETKAIGKQFADSVIVSRKRGNILAPSVFCLYGDLGTGKTTFAQGFAGGLGITTRLLSPTYLIVRRYRLTYEQMFFYHVDLYRTQTQKDLADIGISEILKDPDSVILIEWAEKLGSLMPPVRTDIKFSLSAIGIHHIHAVTI